MVGYQHSPFYRFGNSLLPQAVPVGGIFVASLLGPEALFMLMYHVSPSYRVFLGASDQYLRFGSRSYRPMQPGDRIPGATLQTLPRQLELQSVKPGLGFSFTTSGLIPGR